MKKVLLNRSDCHVFAQHTVSANSVSQCVLVSERQTGRFRSTRRSTCCRSSVAVIGQQELICSSGVVASN